MPAWKIVLGNKNYSSWSLRPWLALKQTGEPFDEHIIPLDTPSTTAEIGKVSPSGRVPCLTHGELKIWDSLAICEYLNEQFPKAQLWPADSSARACARSVSAEMHSSFGALRTAMPMKIRESIPTPAMTPELRSDIARVQEIWTDCRQRFGAGGAFLFGAFTIADAMFAPVVTRFRSYGVALTGEPAKYSGALWNHAPMKEWVAAAQAEPMRLARYDR